MKNYLIGFFIILILILISFLFIGNKSIFTYLKLKKEFEKQIQGSGFEHLTSTLYTQENYDYSKTINYLEPINTRRNINIDDYIPNFKLYY